MKSVFQGAALALTLALAGSAAVPETQHAFAASAASALAAPAPFRLTESDVEASNQKIAAAYQHLVGTWTDAFRQVGERFVPPRIARYRGTTMTSCGRMPANNAVYCPSRNTVFYDEVFVAAQARAAANELGTDGDMAAIGIIAHETGHAVALQLGYRGRFTYDNEKAADCLAGAFARQADRDGALERGDVDEAFFGMASAADPEPELTGDVRTDRRIVQRQVLMGHGTREQRMANFRTGLQRGARACIPQLAALR